MRTAVVGEIARAVEVLFEPGAVVELRAFKDRETISGYFDDREEFAHAAQELDRRGYEVYVTLNEVNPDLLARAANRVKRYPKATTADHDIVRRRWVLVDLDAIRPSGVSASGGEKEAAKVREREVYEHLKAQGWPEPVIGDSGNGYHLLYRVDLPNDEESLALVQGVLKALAFKFSDESVIVDTTTANAARLCKLPGVTARKGDSTEDRPHRSSKLLRVPESPEAAPREKLEAVAAMRPSPPPRDSDPRRNGHKEFDVAAWIAEHDVAVKRESAWHDGHRWILEECPFNGHTDDSAYIVRFANGAVAAGCHHNSCQGYGWRDLRKHYEPGSYENNGRPSGPDAGREEEWDDPVPLPDGLPPVAPFDPVLLPHALRPWCADLAERMQVPFDYVAAGAITTAASLVGRKLGIHPKRHDDWFVVPNLWAGIIGPPSAMKSPALAEATKPLDRLVAEARAAHAEALAEYEAEVAAVEAIRAGIREQIKAAGKRAVKTEDRSELHELIERLRNTTMPEPPTERRYKTNDPTTEKLAELQRENPHGLLVQRDELTGWLRSFDKQGREADRSFYLEAWNGTGSYTVDRIGRGTLHIPALCVSILGGIQPGPLRSYVYGATRGGEGADGLLQRFQLLVWPDPPAGEWRNVDRYPDADAKNTAYAAYKALDDLDPEKVGAAPDALVEHGGIPTVKFSPEAQEVFDAWRHELETKLRREDLPEAFISHLAKYRSLMPSLALIFYLLDAHEAEANAGAVGVEEAQRAAAWCEYLETHARRVYASGESPALEGARALLARIRKGDVKDGDTLRSVYRGRQWSRLSTAEEVGAAASVLEDYGWLRVEKAGTGGRPTTLLRLHPSIVDAT